MKVLIYGIGGVGGYFGGRIAQAGYETIFIARGKHLETIKKEGLRVKSFKGDFTVFPSLATDNLEHVGRVDLIVLAVKSWQVAEAAIAVKSVMHDATVVLPIQNGADNADRVVEVLGDKQVLGGLCRIISMVERPGVVFHKAFEPEILFGELDGRNTERTKKIKEVFDKAGFNNRISENIQLDIWKKFIFICTLSGIGGLTRVPIDTMRNDPGIRSIMKNTAEEMKAVANAKGIDLTDEDIDKMFQAIDKVAPGATASMQRDIMEGKPSELENFNGYIVKQGKQLGVPTPVNSFIYHCLSPMEKRARQDKK